MTKIIGLTGGIGSGKTTLANYLKSLGIPVYIADEEAKKLFLNPIILQKIKTAFGETIFENNLLSKDRLAKIVFNDAPKLKKLNDIIHPAVKAHFEIWLKQFSDKPFVVKEAEILFESGSYKDCDVIITVIAPLKTRIERVIQRDQIGRSHKVTKYQNAKDKHGFSFRAAILSGC